MSILVRSVLIGTALFGAAGAVIGLVLGLRAYVPTAWAAVIEVGLPAALLGALLGLIAGGIATLARRGR
ncbi:hypothetical protein [Nocardioides nematodiphilus]|uniref:hypothetical protein n=1 Tax=Nocardioides nematodiphilus TaxID=2849669 RepID=UPI001CD98481|nr:hypothetical protein [Nocardioides nematodiphilus]MCA1984515.1 hypothetical protein [Nocardioides nematodiphilus]